MKISTHFDAVTLFLKLAIENIQLETVHMLATSNQHLLKANSDAIQSSIEHVLSTANQKVVIEIAGALIENGLIFNKNTLSAFLRKTTNLDIIRFIYNHPLISFKDTYYNASLSPSSIALSSKNYAVCEFFINEGFNLKLSNLSLHKATLVSLFREPKRLAILLRHLDSGSKHILIRSILDLTDRNIIHSYLGENASAELVRLMNKTQLNSLLVSQSTINAAYNTSNIDMLDCLSSLNLPIKCTLGQGIELEKLVHSEVVFLKAVDALNPQAKAGGLKLAVENNLIKAIDYYFSQLEQSEINTELFSNILRSVFVSNNIRPETIERVLSYAAADTKDILFDVALEATRRLCTSLPMHNHPKILGKPVHVDTLQKAGLVFDSHCVGQIFETLLANVSIRPDDPNINHLILFINSLNDVYAEDLFLLLKGSPQLDKKSLKQLAFSFRTGMSSDNTYIKATHYYLLLSSANNKQRAQLVENMEITNSKAVGSVSIDISTALKLWNTDPLSFVNEHTLTSKTSAKMMKLLVA